MAKAGFYLYGASGKVGNLVARRNPDGGTTLAERKFTIANPRTNQQMAARIILATVAQAVKYMRPIVDHSFQGVATGRKSLQQFRRLNMAKLRRLAAIDFEETPAPVNAHAFMTTKGIQALIPNAYIISKGSLGDPKCKVVNNYDGTQHSKLVVTFPNFNIPIYGETEKYVVLGDILKGMFGITTPGEQITLVLIQRAGENYQYAFQSDPSYPGWEIPFTSMKAQRLVLPLTADLTHQLAITDDQGQPLEAVDEVISEAIVAAFGLSPKTDADFNNALAAWLGGGVFELTYSEDNKYLQLEWDENIGAYPINTYNEDADGLGFVYAAGVIRSRLDSDMNWSFSNATMVLAKPTDVVEENFGLEWNSAIQAWFEKQDVADDEKYLETGTDQNQIGESFT